MCRSGLGVVEVMSVCRSGLGVVEVMSVSGCCEGHVSVSGAVRPTFRVDG